MRQPGHKPRVVSKRKKEIRDEDIGENRFPG